MRKRILILTKSSKRRHDNNHFGNCVAGVSLEPGDNYKWVRLVADEQGDSLLDSQFPYDKLDIVDVELYPCPLNNQIENCCFELYGKVGSKTISELRDIFDKMSHSFFGSMSESFIGRPNNSLTILFAKELHIYRIERNGKTYQKVDFMMGSNHANAISMTDPKYYTKRDDLNDVKDVPCAICIASLPANPLYQDQYKKFIASIFEVSPNNHNNNNLGNFFASSPF